MTRKRKQYLHKEWISSDIVTRFFIILIRQHSEFSNSRVTFTTQLQSTSIQKFLTLMMANYFDSLVFQLNTSEANYFQNQQMKIKIQSCVRTDQTGFGVKWNVIQKWKIDR